MADAPLAIASFDMDEARFERVRDAVNASHKLSVPLSGTSGEVAEHGGDILWDYDGKTLSFKIMKEFHIGFLHYSAYKIQQDLVEWIAGIQ